VFTKPLSSNGSFFWPYYSGFQALGRHRHIDIKVISYTSFYALNKEIRLKSITAI
jgi:hypothetical protein